MTQIDPGHALAQLIRRQVTSLNRPAKGASKHASPGKTGSSGKPTSFSPAGANADLATSVAQRVRSIRRDDPRRNEKAIRVFLESTLIAEFGLEMMDDPAFYQLVEDVQARMSSDPDLARAMKQLSDRMLRFVDAGNPEQTR